MSRAPLPPAEAFAAIAHALREPHGVIQDLQDRGALDVFPAGAARQAAYLIAWNPSTLADAGWDALLGAPGILSAHVKALRDGAGVDFATKRAFRRPVSYTELRSLIEAAAQPLPNALLSDGHAILSAVLFDLQQATAQHQADASDFDAWLADQRAARQAVA